VWIELVDEEMGVLVREGKKRGRGERGVRMGKGGMGAWRVGMGRGMGDGGWMCEGRYSILEMRNIFR